MHLKNILVFFIFLVFNEFVCAQSTSLKKDSTKIYKDIESYSKRSAFSRFIYPLIFKKVRSGKQKRKSRIQKSYRPFEGKIIRFIHTETLDPFGYSMKDTNVEPKNFLSKTGNKLHVKSQSISLRNLLLIRQNQPFDSLLVKESERLVRNRPYIRDVMFWVLATSKNSDSVDIFIRVMDIWSIIPKVTTISSGTHFNVSDNNFLGLGNDFQNNFIMYPAAGTYHINTNYYIPNFRNTYINSTLHYGTDEFGDFTRSFAIDRPFFSPYAKWAAGISFSQEIRKDSIHASNSPYILQRFKYNTNDYWAGKATQLFRGNTENYRTTNLITAIRFLKIRYLDKPIEIYDTEHNFANENFYLASIGISTRKYVQEKFIFKYGLTEDVPIGKVYSITAGYQKKNHTERLYLGARISFGNYYPWGYLSSSCEYGTFVHASHSEQGTFALSVNYITQLFEIGEWKFRQFVKPQLTIGIHRFSSDSLTLNNNSGIIGFNSIALSGTNRLLLTLQTQLYTPWNILGFRFGPYFINSFGLLGNATSGFSNSRLYSQIGFGILIKNENLILNTFQISIAFYPIIPGNGYNVFKLNSFKTTDFGFKDFEIGKPAVVAFQ